MEWLLAPIDPSRPHGLDMMTAWHGRLMVLAWAVCLPAGVFIARFMKITPRQNWPDECDNRFWWYSHIALQSLGGVLTLGALGLIVFAPAPETTLTVHRWAGYTIIAFVVLQFLGAGLRGTRGGPNYPSSDGSWWGDHYNMTRRRCIFEALHKLVGYAALLLAMGTMFLGMWAANGPHWMWVILILWWIVVFAAFAILQRRGLAIDTYQAIWGPEERHPGNQLKPIGWGIRRYQKRE